MEVLTRRSFPTWGSVMGFAGEMGTDLRCRVALTSRVFGVLRKAFSGYEKLKLRTKRKKAEACMLSVFLFGAEGWIPLNESHKEVQ